MGRSRDEPSRARGCCPLPNIVSALINPFIVEIRAAGFGGSTLASLFASVGWQEDLSAHTEYGTYLVSYYQTSEALVELGRMWETFGGIVKQRTIWMCRHVGYNVTGSWGKGIPSRMRLRSSSGR